jgi:hypothetical protein
MHAFAKPVAATLALLAATAVAAAQAQAPIKQDTVPPMTGQNKSDQGGKAEPSAKVEGTAAPTSTVVLENGILAVPGAPPDSQTAPAKFSAKNAASDELPISGRTFTHLNDAQRSAMHGSIMAKTPTSSVVRPEIGIQVAFSEELKFLPEDVVAQAPSTRGYQYTTSGNSLLLVEPSNRIVVGVIDR